ncbi:unnamed protein product [Parascedosporium putredinis]|uniref:histidine kinase n=1 Tax=Parascedosporium putredinis TaxID=1442378 RepID=A0A9P1MEH1_9PEZI|nr:unnamed protein product [Parascedosporium putredinis]CAI8000528.1 unnamed protein product [Parascedosporium putredinis]
MWTWIPQWGIVWSSANGYVLCTIMLLQGEVCFDKPTVPGPPPAVESSERARQREISGYLSAASFPSISPLPFCPKTPSSTTMPPSTPSSNSGRCASTPIARGLLGVCPTTMKAFMDETGEWIRTGPNIIANRTRYIIHDFRADPLYVDRPYVASYPHMVSYLEVPLISPLGYVLGSYCVVDNKARDFDNEESVGVLNEIAAVIMNHLDLIKTRQNRHRAEKVMGGMTTFIQEATPSSQPEIVLDPFGLADHSPPEAPLPWTPASPLSLPSPIRPPLQRYNSIDMVMSDGFAPSLGGASSCSPSDSSASPLGGPTAPSTHPTTPREEIPEVAAELYASTPAALKAAVDNANASAAFTSSSNIKSVFFRAATTIRKSMDMDGLAFVDAVPSARTEANDVSCAADKDGAVNLRQTQIPLHELTLQKFILRFPRGHVFSADEFGPIDESYGLGKRYPGNTTAAEGGTIVDDDRECWYAAALGWVADPAKVIDVADINLVAAFCNSVMGEVSRLETVAVSYAKSNFVSSISHELRSPLHGIMTSSELLRENIPDKSFLSTLDMLDSCGKTLLDTFDNLLDHAIMINEGKRAKTFLSNSREVDLAGLVEEVVDAVSISRLPKPDGISSSYPENNYTSDETRQRTPEQQPLVTLEVRGRENWNLRLNVGVWKRIVMNIFGNAFKYTTSGRIDVTLYMTQEKDKSGKMSDHICFTVEDTGCGMTSDYVKYRLYTPFSQEDEHSPGMGLGLSIVQQLVTVNGGKINITSSRGHGTLVKVVVPVSQDFADDPPPPPQGLVATGCSPYQKFQSLTSPLRGRTVCIITPEAYAALTGSCLDPSPDIQARSALIERALSINAGTALGMTVLIAPSSGSVPNADVYVLDSLTAKATPTPLTNAVHTILDTISRPLVLLYPSTTSPPPSIQHATPCLYLQGPIGPIKLSSTILAAFNMAQIGEASHQRKPPPKKLSRVAKLRQTTGGTVASGSSPQTQTRNSRSEDLRAGKQPQHPKIA